jgi:hypothetical protein
MPVNSFFGKLAVPMPQAIAAMRLTASKVLFEHQDSRTVIRPLHLGFQFGIHQDFGIMITLLP